MNLDLSALAESLARSKAARDLKSAIQTSNAARKEWWDQQTATNPVCCNQACRQGRDCPVRMAAAKTH